jgi:hypothetical protein
MMCERVQRCRGPISWRWSAAPGQDDSWNLIALVVDLGVHAAPLFHSYPLAIIGVEELDGETAAERLREGRVVGAQEDAPEVSLPVPENVVPQWIYGWEEWGATDTGWPAACGGNGSRRQCICRSAATTSFARVALLPLACGSDR